MLLFTTYQLLRPLSLLSKLSWEVVVRAELGLCQSKQKLVSGESIYFTCSLASGIMQRFVFFLWQGTGWALGLFLLECCYRDVFWRPHYGTYSAQGSVGWGILKGFKCPSQPCWVWEGGHLGPKRYWRLLEVEQNILPCGDTITRLNLFSDPWFNLSSEETCVKVCIGVFQLWKVSRSCFGESEAPSSRLWLI